MNLRSLCSAGMLVAAGLLASRLLGFAREALIAASYGTGADASMAIGLLIIPDYITSILIGGACSAVLLPAFSSRTAQQRLALFWQSLLLSVVVFTVLALLVYSQSGAIITALHGQAGNVPHAALFWSLCSMPLAGAGGVITAWLQYHSRFAVPAFANALFNLVIVLTLWQAPSGFAVLGLGIFTAGLARLVLFVYGFSGTGAGLLPILQGWQLSRRLLGHYAAAVGNSFCSLLPQYAPYVIITLLAGQLALFNYAFKLVLLPGMLINTIIGMVLLPRFVHVRKQGTDIPEYAGSLRIGVTLSVAMTLVLWLASWHIVTLCFGHGAMTEADVQQVARIFAIGVWALPGMVAGYLYQQIFYANERPGIPFMIGAGQAALSIPLVWLGQQWMAEAGVMAAYVLLQLLPVALFMLLAERNHIISLRQQWQGSASMLLAVLLVFVPLAILFYNAELSASMGLLAAMVMGGIMLMAAGAADTQIRQWINTYRTRI